MINSAEKLQGEPGHEKPPLSKGRWPSRLAGEVGGIQNLEITALFKIYIPSPAASRPDSPL